MPDRTALTLAVLGLAAALVTLSPAEAGAKGKRRKLRRPAEIAWVVTPLGRQGIAGAGPNVVLPFGLADDRREPADVEVQYGIDRNADGRITDDEFRPATEDRLDPHNTRRDDAPQLFATGTPDGAANAFVWKSTADVGPDRLAKFEFLLTPQGRPVPDPDNPGSFVHATGPGGNPELGGVRLRVRAVRSQGRRKPLLVGPWVGTDAFTVDNTTPPSMTIDSVADGDTVLADWTVSDANSEDLNGNGVLDVADGEDVNGNGQLDAEQVGVAFDFHAITIYEDPEVVAAMTDAQLANIGWRPCARAPGIGNTDSLEVSLGLPIPDYGDGAGLPSAAPRVGRHWVFAWDATRQVGSTPDGCLIRATPFDQTRTRGATVYFRGLVHAGN